MATQTTEPFVILENTTATLTGTLQDEAGDPVALDNVATMTLRLYDEETRTVINSRSGQNVKNANNVTIHATSGLVTWLLQTADTIIVGSPQANGKERHIALFTWTYPATPTKTGRKEIKIDVQQVEKVGT